MILDAFLSFVFGHLFSLVGSHMKATTDLFGFVIFLDLCTQQEDLLLRVLCSLALKAQLTSTCYMEYILTTDRMCFTQFI